MYSVLIQVSQKCDVHQRNLYLGLFHKIVCNYLILLFLPNLWNAKVYILTANDPSHVKWVVQIEHS